MDVQTILYEYEYNMVIAYFTEINYILFKYLD